MLGLSRKRWLATDEDVRKNYRKLVLKYHPDKSEQGKLHPEKTSHLFKLIQKAYEQISNSTTRRQFDSVDPTFDEDIPAANLDAESFFEEYGPVFASNGRFSKTQPVPELGSLDDPREKVDSFYSFWYHFESWRSFELLDEEKSESAENRDEKRWIEKQNRAARAKRKKEDMARIIRLVENAMKLDPRLIKFREQDRRAKEEKKRAATEAKELEQKRQREEAERQKEEKLRLEKEEKENRESNKKAKEALKQAIRKEKKAIKQVIKDYDYFLATDMQDDFDKVTEQMAQLEKWFDKYKSLDELVQLRKEFSISREHAENIFFAVEETKVSPATVPEPTTESSKQEESVDVSWSEKDKSLLLKAFNMFPGGTVDRWNKITDFVNAHSETVFTVSQVIKTSSSIKGNPLGSRPVAPSDSAATTPVPAAATAPTPTSEWSPEEHSKLESALRSNPASDPERWDKIASFVGTKNKKECIVRFKEIAIALKASKA